jgi:tricorn protease
VTSVGYVRYPHLRGDLLTFVADDDVWLAPVAGGRAWRLSAEGAPVSYPRLSPDGGLVAWTTARDNASEIYLSGVDGTGYRRLTYWGDRRTRVTGWNGDGEILAISATGQPAAFLTWAHAVPVTGAAARRLEFGPAGDIAVNGPVTALLTSTQHEPAHWKRYRGGTSGRLWIRAAENGAFTRILPGLAGQVTSPMLVGMRIVFLSDHEGTGNLYSCALDGSGLRRHTDHDGFYARNPSSDGHRVVYHVAGQIWILDDLDAEPRRVEVMSGSPSAARVPRLISAANHLGSLSCDQTGQASVVEVRGTVHWLTHRDGPARALAVDPDTRARLPVVLGRSGGAAWISDATGQDSLVIIVPAGAERTGDNAGDGPAAQDENPSQDGPAARDEKARDEKAQDEKAQDEKARDEKAQDEKAQDEKAQDENPSQDESASQNGAAPSPVTLADGQLGSVVELTAAPDGTAVAAAASDGRVFLVEIGSSDVTELAASDDGPAGGLSWSTDSAWLAWSEPGPQPLSRIRIARRRDAQVADVTDGRFSDTDPVFTADGRYLAFLSLRSFDPVYDAHFFDLSFPFGSRPYLVPLAATTPSPFAPLPQGRPAGPGATDKNENHDHSERTSVRVDPDGLADRVVRVPVPEARYSSLQVVKGGLAWLREPVSGVLGENAAYVDDDGPRAVLERFDLARRKCTELVDELDWFTVSGDGTRVVVADGHEVRVLSSERKHDGNDADDDVTVDLSRARFVADPVALWRHAYEEAGRLMRRDFWVPDMAGVDWDGVLAEYRPLLDRISGASDFADLLWEVFGELATSHAYVVQASDGTSPRRGGRAAQVGLLGADLAPDAGGRWRVSRVLPGESSDPRALSPLAAPGVAIAPGDELLAVDGQPLDEMAGPGPRLVGAAGKPVELTVRRDGGRLRRVVVTPLRDDRRLRYQDWVNGRRALVRELGRGRLGYLHIPDMMGEGWAHFHRDLRTEMRHDGLIVDARGNRGGHVSQLIVEKLARRVIAWDMPRAMLPETYPMDAPRGPLVALADEFAGSDGDIVTAAIRTLGLGPVVGTRTWGGVIGIEGMPGHLLVDGTRMTVPRFAYWFSEYGWDVENYGVDPDIEVFISPDDWAAGRDPQLETGIRIALQALAERPAVTPPDRSTRPAKGRPPLPPRAR